MPEVILPCPACGSNDSECIFGEDEMYSVDCGNCAMRGPAERNPDAAIAAYNTIPRALRWTHEPPKVAGIYLIRSMFDGEQQGSIGVITVKTPFDYDKSHFMQFAGPIAPPVEG